MPGVESVSSVVGPANPLGWDAGRRTFLSTRYEDGKEILKVRLCVSDMLSMAWV